MRPIILLLLILYALEAYSARFHSKDAQKLRFIFSIPALYSQ